jgi:hypothetical protein
MLGQYPTILAMTVSFHILLKSSFFILPFSAVRSTQPVKYHPKIWCKSDLLLKSNHIKTTNNKQLNYTVTYMLSEYDMQSKFILDDKWNEVTIQMHLCLPTIPWRGMEIKLTS